MKRGLSWRLPAIWAMVVVCGGATTRGPVLEMDSVQEKALAEAAGPGFRVKRTSHFLVAFDTRPEVVDDLTARLEQTYHMVFQFCEMNGIDAHYPDRRLEVLFFDKRVAYERYLARVGLNGAGTFGMYQPMSNRSFFFNAANDEQVLKLQSQIAAANANVDQLERSIKSVPADGTRVEVTFADGRRIMGTKAEIEKKVAKEIDSVRADLKKAEGRRRDYCEHVNQTTVQHETAHQTLTNAGLHVRGAGNPKWLVEGLACLFETPPGPPGSGFSILNTGRLEDFRNAVGGNAKKRLTSRDYERAVAAGTISSPKQLILEPGLFDARGGEVGLRSYALAWAMAHYLQRNEREAFARYLLDISVRMPGDNPSPEQELELFEDHFGPIDEAFLRKFSGYILGLATRSSSGP
jgi:hypothetical protein